MARITKPIVRTIDRVGAVGITVGGVGIIAAVLVIMLYLAWNVAPLFKSGVLYGARTGKLTLAAPVVDAVADEYKGLLITLLADGRVQPVDLQTMSPREVGAEGVAPVTDGAKVTAVSVINEYGQMALGYDDGSVQIGAVGTKVEFVDPKDMDAATPDGLKASRLPVGGRTPLAGGYAEMTPQGQLRVVKPSYTLNKAAMLTTGEGAVVKLDFRSTASAQFLVTARADGTVEFSRVTIVRPLGAGKPRASLTSLPVAFAAPAGKPKTPDYLFALGEGTNILAVWKDGTVQRYALKVGVGDQTDSFALAETVDIAENGRTLTAARLLLGSKTLVIADDAGEVSAAFPAKVDTMRTFDGWSLVVAHEFNGSAGGGGGACSALGIALRDRTVVMGDVLGGITVRHVTSEKLVVEQAGVLNEPVALAMITPKGDGVIALGASGTLSVMDLDPGHAEASVKGMFGKIWYEGDAGPSYTYQASTGEDTAEVKYSNIPLIFGTIKSTVYAMLFAVPLAIMAALYTSEFLHPRVKNRVKPVIEMMASLPSVVLGFLVSIVIAPIFRDYLPAVMMSFLVLPVGVLAAAYLWQLLPVRVASRVGSLQHISMVLVVVLISGAASVGLGRVMERVLFSPSDADILALAGSVVEVPREEYPRSLQDKRSIEASDVRPFRADGLYYASGKIVRPTGAIDDPRVHQTVVQNDLERPDMRLWLDGLIGTPRAGWVLLMTPVGLLLAAGLRARLIDHHLDSMEYARVGTGAAIVEIGKFAITLAAGMGLAVALAAGLASAGFDARDSIFGSYTQRNTLVVGVAMGFAIIPIIYTISEDSLSAVPGQLRSASLGCGATRWQTATRVVLPIALSGIFSAVMIGLGRAAGETMIVLMSTGNTPNMDWNIFSGFRTLSANIATEMPEAPKDSTHYRALFLSALCLFALTFMVNTVAEVVRQRVRRTRAAL